MKKRIAIDAGAILPFPGKHLSGIGRTTLELIRMIEVLGDIPFELVLFGQRLNRERFQRYGFSSPVRYLPLPRWQCFNWVRNRLPTVELLTGADLIHIPSNYAPVFAPQRTVVTIHDAMFLSYHEEHLHNERSTHDVLGLALNCKAVITCSQSSKNDLVSYGSIDPEKIHVIYWGYDNSLFYYEKDRSAVLNYLSKRFHLNTPYFLSVSCDIGRKSSPEVVEQFLRMASEEQQHQLVLVWSNPPETTLAMVSSHPEGKRVQFLRNVTDEELRYLYNGATALLFPSKYEGFGLPLLEAMACGTPVLTCNISSLPEVGGSVASYIEPGDDQALFHEMLSFAQQKYPKEKLREKCIRQAENFSWKECALKTIHVYEQALCSQSGNKNFKRFAL